MAMTLETILAIVLLFIIVVALIAAFISKARSNDRDLGHWHGFGPYARGRRTAHTQQQRAVAEAELAVAYRNCVCSQPGADGGFAHPAAAGMAPAFAPTPAPAPAPAQAGAAGASYNVPAAPPQAPVYRVPGQ